MSKFVGFLIYYQENIFKVLPAAEQSFYRLLIDLS